MKKRFLAFLLSAAIALTSVIGSPFSVLAADEEPREIPECTCTYQPQGIYSHNYGCPYQAFFYGMSDNTLWTAEQIFAMWDEFNEVEQAFILEYLKNNAWQCGDKLDELIILIEGGSTDPEDPELEQQTLSCSPINGVTISIEGMLPEGTAVAASAAQLPDGDMPEDVTILGFDISLSYNGAEYQPEEAVTLSFAGLTLYENPLVGIIHVLDDAQAIQNGIANGNAFASDDADLVALHPEEAALTASVTGESGVVFVEAMSTVDGSISISGDGAVHTSVSSFSDYYVVSGNTANGSTAADVIYINDSENNTYYVAPGTVINFQRGRARDDEALFVWAKKDSGTNALNITAKAWLRRNFIAWVDAEEIEIGNNYTTGGSLLAPNHIRNPIVVTVGNNAQPGEIYKLRTSRVSSGSYEVVTTVIVMSQDNIIANVLDPGVVGTQYPVYLSVVKNAQNGIPGEPSLSSVTSMYAGSNYGIGSDGTVSFATNGSGIISSNIASNPNFTSAADGTNTIGVVDASGVNTKAAVSNINWNSLLDGIAASGTVKATDGTTVTNANKGNYEVIPYVVKLQTAYDVGWHIDCYVKAKDAITVSYDANIPSGYTVANIGVPGSDTVAPNSSVTLKYLIKDTTADNPQNLAVNGKVTAQNGNQSYELTFKGWNTKSDGSGTDYNPGATHAFSEDTVLYAVWQSNISVGNLEIHNVVDISDGSEDPDESDTFTYTVTFMTNSGARPYTIYDKNGNPVSGGSGSISSGGSITLGVDQWVRITDVPNGAYSVTQSSAANYTTSSNGSSGSIKGGATSRAVFTNLYNVPKEYTISYVLDGGTASGNPAVYTIVTPTFTLVNPVKTGYTFLGWTGSNGDAAQTTVSVVKGTTGDLTYTANWLINKHAATAAGGTGVTAGGSGEYNYNSSVSFTADLINGYAFDGWYTGQTDGTKLSANTTYTFAMPDSSVTYYARAHEKTVDYNYIPVCTDSSATDYGTVTTSSAQLLAVTGSASGSTAAVGEGFTFKGWYTDPADDTTLVSSNLSFAPSKSTVNGHAAYAGGTYYAVFEPIPVSSLTIQKSGYAAVDTNQSFIFIVSGKFDGVQGTMYVTVQGNGSVTITGLTVGESYTVTEQAEWSWRYTPAGSVSKTLAADASQNVLTVANTRSGSKWLSSCDCKVNKAE